MLEQGHLTLSPVVSYCYCHHHYYFSATCLKEEIFNMSASLGKMCPWHRWFAEEKSIFTSALSSAFILKCRPWVGRDRGVTPGLSLRNQFPQRGQSSMDADVQSVFKVIAGEILLCLKK